MSASPIRVLVVDDETLIRWSVRQLLAANGHVVAEAGDGAAARAILKGVSQPIDVVLLDCRLPDNDDLSLLQDVKRFSPSSAVVMMTAHRTPEMATAAVESGARCVLDKPFDLHILEPLVRQAGESARSRAASAS